MVKIPNIYVEKMLKENRIEKKNQSANSLLVFAFDVRCVIVYSL